MKKETKVRKEISKQMSNKILNFISKKLSDRISFYADDSNYRDSACSPDDRYTNTPILEDKGSQARECQKLLNFLATWDRYSLVEEDHDLLDGFIENEDQEFSTALYTAWWK